MPESGLFADQTWRISPTPFPLGSKLARELDSLGRVLLKFYQAVNLLYRQSAEGRQPAWVAQLLDQGKPDELLALQHSPVFKNAIPRIIRPDILLTDDGFSITELDSVPGGIGLTAWLNQTYSRSGVRSQKPDLVGTASSMLEGFSSIFDGANNIHIVVSQEAASYRPEMEWLAAQLGSRFRVRDADFMEFEPGDAVYRFFELFDLDNVPNHRSIFDSAARTDLIVTPPPRAFFEEKLLSALLWNHNLREFWRTQLGEGFLKRLQGHTPYSWVVDPTPLPPHAGIPRLDITDWQQLKTLSHRQRDLVLKVSGFSPHAWGARGVYLGSDLSGADWGEAVDRAVRDFPTSPWVLQRYTKPRSIESAWFDFERERLVPMHGRVRLCPYYFVSGEGPAARTSLGGVLATICPADKKIIHGMSEAILAPCSV